MKTKEEIQLKLKECESERVKLQKQSKKPFFKKEGLDKILTSKFGQICALKWVLGYYSYPNN